MQHLFRLPIPVDMKSKNLAKELETALKKSTMSMKNNGVSYSIRIGLSNFEEEQLVENIMAVYDTLSKKFPGKFANIRNLNLRFGGEEWSVPIYISYGQQYLFIIYILKNCKVKTPKYLFHKLGYRKLF